MISRVQTKTNTGAAPTLTITWNSNTTSGNTIFVVVGDQSSSSSVVSITDSQTNTYTKVDSGSNTVQGELWISENITGGATPTITVTLLSIFNAAAIAREYSGLPTSSSTDQHTITTASNTAVISATPSVSTQPKELAIGYIATSTTVPTVAAPFANLTTVSGTGVIVGMADKIFNAIDTQRVTFTVGGAENSVLGVAGFKANETGNGVRSNKLRPRVFAPGLAR